MKKLLPISLFMWLLISPAWGQTCSTTISTYPYFQNFDTGAGGWTVGGTGSTFALGTPSKSNISAAASAPNAWVTNLTGNYSNNESGYVLSPCFNFSTIVQPIFSAKIYWDSENNWDGAVLQSSINGGTTWQNVGALNDPNNWYNNGSITGSPGGQPVGWCGSITSFPPSGSNGWVLAKHALTGLGGQANVRLRIAFGSDGSVNNYDGFAFDDVTILETPSIDIQVAAVTSPTSGCALTATENVCVTLTNKGIAAQSNIPVSYQVGTNTPVTETVTTTIAPNASFTYCFTQKVNLSTPGNYAITVSSSLAGDGDPSNNSLITNVISVPVISSFPYSQNFENGQGGWRAGGTGSSWAFGTPAKTTIIGASSGVNAWVTGLTGTYNSSENSYVVSPCFNFAGLTGDPDFEMKAWWSSETNWDGAVLQSSINGGTSWQNVGALNDPNNWYNNGSINGAPGGQAIGWSGTGTTSSGGWIKVKHKLNGMAGQSAVLLRVAFGADSYGNYDGFAFDDIRIGDNSNNLAINKFSPLTQVCGFGTNENVEVEIENLGGVAVNNYQLQYRVDNGNWINSSGTMPNLLPDTPIKYKFTQGADLSTSGPHAIEVKINNNQGTDPEIINNTIIYNVTNALFNTMAVNLDFETPATSVTAARSITRLKSVITEVAGVGNGTTASKGLIMDGIDDPAWEVPVGLVDPWIANPDNFSAVYICLAPTNIGLDTLRLSFDLKQFYKTTNYNTNFRVTVNGNQVGTTFKPPFGGYPTGTMPTWQNIVIDLTPFKNQGGIQIGLESSVREGYQNGAGTANVIDNVLVEQITVTNGIKENALQNQLLVFPNPSNGLFQVKVPVATRSFTAEVTDLTGKIVKTLQVKNNSGTEPLNLSGTAKGIYILKITSEGNTATRKLIVE